MGLAGGFEAKLECEALLAQNPPYHFNIEDHTESISFAERALGRKNVGRAAPITFPFIVSLFAPRGK